MFNFERNHLEVKEIDEIKYRINLNNDNDPSIPDIKELDKSIVFSIKEKEQERILEMANETLGQDYEEDYSDEDEYESPEERLLYKAIESLGQDYEEDYSDEDEYESLLERANETLGMSDE